MSIYYWEDGPRRRFESAVEEIRHDRRVDELTLTAFEHEMALDGVFTLEQLEMIVKAMRRFKTEVSEAKAKVTG